MESCHLGLSAHQPKSSAHCERCGVLLLKPPFSRFSVSSVKVSWGLGYLGLALCWEGCSWGQTLPVTPRGVSAGLFGASRRQCPALPPEPEGVHNLPLQRYLQRLRWRIFPKAQGDCLSIHFLLHNTKCLGNYTLP